MAFLSQETINIYIYIKKDTQPGGMTAGFNYYRTALEDIKYNRETSKGRLQMPVLAVGGDRSFGAGVAASLQQVAGTARRTTPEGPSRNAMGRLAPVSAH